jgi:hypothetical protein
LPDFLAGLGYSDQFPDGSVRVGGGTSRRALGTEALVSLVIAVVATIFFLVALRRSHACALCRAHLGPLVATGAGRAVAPLGFCVASRCGASLRYV